MEDCTLSFHEKQFIINYPLLYSWEDFYLIIWYTEHSSCMGLRMFLQYVHIIILTTKHSRMHYEYRKFIFKLD